MCNIKMPHPNAHIHGDIPEHEWTFIWVLSNMPKGTHKDGYLLGKQDNKDALPHRLSDKGVYILMGQLSWPYCGCVSAGKENSRNSVRWFEFEWKFYALSASEAETYHWDIMPCF